METPMPGGVQKDIKKRIERDGLTCDCGERVYKAGAGAIEGQPHYTRYFEYLECFKCKKLYCL
jgi:uncharacterized protein with PIN domain